MFGIVINGRPPILSPNPASGVVESAPGKYSIDIPDPGEVRVVVNEFP